MSLKDGFLTVRSDAATGAEGKWANACESFEASQEARRETCAGLLQYAMRPRDTHNSVMGEMNQQFARWNNLLDVVEAQVSVAERTRQSMEREHESL